METSGWVRIPRIPRYASRSLLEHGYSRVPVYDGSVDNVIGYIAAKDILALAWGHHPMVLDDVIRAPYFVPETKGIVALMSEMREKRVPFATS